MRKVLFLSLSPGALYGDFLCALAPLRETFFHQFHLTHATLAKTRMIVDDVARLFSFNCDNRAAKTVAWNNLMRIVQVVTRHKMLWRKNVLDTGVYPRTMTSGWCNRVSINVVSVGELLSLWWKAASEAGHEARHREAATQTISDSVGRFAVRALVAPIRRNTSSGIRPGFTQNHTNQCGPKSALRRHMRANSGGQLRFNW